MQTIAPAPEPGLAETLRSWLTREGTILVASYGSLIAVLCPAFYFVALVLPDHVHDSMLLRLAAAALSLSLAALVLCVPASRPHAYRLQFFSITFFLCVLVALLVDSGNSVWYLTSTVIGMFVVQYAFLRWQDIVLSYGVAFAFEVVYSAVRGALFTPGHTFVLASILFTSIVCVASGILRMRSIYAEMRARVRLEARSEEIRRQAERITHLAYSDSLTGLSNRTAMNERIDLAISYARRHARQLALLYLDLNGFKAVNDRFGHDVGDLVLMGAALRIQYILRNGESVGRIGGDEFVVLIPLIESAEEPAAVARRINEALREPISAGEREFTLSASIGIAVYPQNGHSRLDLLAFADKTMYALKHEGRREALTAHGAIHGEGGI